MNEQLIVSASHSQSRDISSYLGVSKRKLLLSEQKILMDILGVMSYHRIDDETSVAILRSFELKSTPPEEFGRRLNNFKLFLDSIDHRDNLIESVKNLGMLSKSELEERAKENGDWISVIKRNEADSKLREQAIRDEQNSIVTLEESNEEKTETVELEEPLIPLSTPGPNHLQQLRDTLERRTEIINAIISRG